MKILLEFFALFLILPNNVDNLTFLEDLNQNDFDLVRNLELSDHSNSFLIDGLPIYFNLNFTVFQEDYSIFFKQNLYKYNEVLEPREFYKTYESVSVNIRNKSYNNLKAQAVLLANYDSYSILKSSGLDSMKRSFKKKPFNLIQFFNLFFDIKNDDLLISINLNPNNTKSREYIANRKLLPRQSSTRQKRSSTKVTLTVESCVHVDFQIYQIISNFLLTEDQDYIQIYFNLYFTQIFLIIDKIYKSIGEDTFEIDIKLSELVLHRTPNPGFNNETSKNISSYLKFINGYISDYYSFSDDEKFPKCDHVFYVRQNPIDNVVGLAYNKDVCRKNGRASTTLFTPGMEAIMAHELGHNLGSEHDDISEKTYKINCTYKSFLMSRYAYNVQSTQFLSNCSIIQFKKALFENERKVYKRFECLINKYFNETEYLSEYKKLALKNLPGQFLSHSDQCKILANDSNSYSCSTMHDEIAMCLSISCYIKDLKECKNMLTGVLDGTFCNTNKLCLYKNCVPQNEYTEYKAWKFQNKWVTNELEEASRTIRETCPSGVSQEETVFKNIDKNEELYLNNSNCDEIFLNKEIPRKHRICDHRYFLSSACCEKCLQYNTRKCFEEDRKICQLPTCESLGKNPCFNGGKCVNDPKNQIVGYKCVCKNGFKGPLCMSFDPCSFSPCSENEICVTFGTLGQYYCLCPTDHVNYPFCDLEFKYLNGTLKLVSKRSSWRKILNITLLSLIILAILSIFLYKIFYFLKSKLN